MNNTTRTTTIGRRGIAPLEFVMLLPLLATLMTVLFVLVRTSLQNISVIEESRYETWQALPDAETRRPLSLQPPLDDGAAEHFAEHMEDNNPWWVTEEIVVDSRNQSLGDTWDEASVPFAEGQPPFLVHQQPMELIAQSIAVGPGVNAMTKAFAAAMNMSANPLIQSLASMSAALNPVVRAAGVLLAGLRPVLAATRAGLRVLQAIARATGRWGFARFLGRVIDLLTRGIRAFGELNTASKGHKVGWR